MFSQSLFEDQADMSSQLGFFTFPPNYNNNMGSAITTTTLPFGICNHKTLTIIPPSFAADNNSLIESTALRQKEDLTTSIFGGPHLLSLQKSTANTWAWGEVNESNNIKRSRDNIDDHLGVSAIKMKKMKSSRRKVREPRFCFKTLSDVDVLDDGYKWRKYGQKVVKNTQHPRSYYRCTQDNCRVKKRVERLAEDPRMVITTYEGRHVHSPSLDEEDSQASSQLNNLLW
ncbi:probable WRKY transcription factor 12 [Nicotiana tomentosiformis]|uniref:Probable WRKY transcription factor 13 n=1 Tax=Nicotiana tabacum TaxID=4097 RepID=A0A1S4AW95_TOBAC|nr:probable WRKY transcription factor 13 isoform X1 [Nicotiana tomentosiformis]XP_016480880.1 PREDICTED: probable WRKY transcription factor 13 [Nicotiana tabacum]XP_018634566.1 probable WRKY transcription factor 13 isoform X2 [Nicotiana tomentosiformis]